MKLLPHIRKSKQRSQLIKYALVIVLSFGLMGYMYYTSAHHSTAAGRLVTFHDRGTDHVIVTRATTVRAALKEAKITVEPQDIVEPVLDSEFLTTDSAVIIYRARPVLVVDGALRQKVMTPAQSPNEIATAAGLAEIGNMDKTTFAEGNFVQNGVSRMLTIERTAVTPIKVAYVPGPNALTKSRGAQQFTDSSGVTHRETYYDLPMNRVVGACSDSDYTIRSDGAKIDKDGYVLVAASYRVYPHCSIVETSMGPGKVYDTGGFALRYPHGFDLATDWTNYNGR